MSLLQRRLQIILLEELAYDLVQRFHISSEHICFLP